MLYYKFEIWNKEGDGFISVPFNAQPVKDFSRTWLGSLITAAALYKIVGMTLHTPSFNCWVSIWLT